jgi:hypothetical protein
MTIDREQFEYWLADMDDALERFFATLPPEVRDRLDYSPQSLDVLEQWMLSKYSKMEQVRQPSESKTLDGIARYIGETYRKNLGGHWEIRLDDPKYAFYGLPQLTGYSAKPTPSAPLPLATAAVDRRTGNYWSTILANKMERAGKGPAR